MPCIWIKHWWSVSSSCHDSTWLPLKYWKVGVTSVRLHLFPHEPRWCHGVNAWSHGRLLSGHPSRPAPSLYASSRCDFPPWAEREIYKMRTDSFSFWIIKNCESLSRLNQMFVPLRLFHIRVLFNSICCSIPCDVFPASCMKRCSVQPSADFISWRNNWVMIQLHHTQTELHVPNAPAVLWVKIRLCCHGTPMHCLFFCTLKYVTCKVLLTFTTKLT